MVASPSQLGRRERKKEETRDALVAAAVSLFAERGFEATTVEDIAEVADVSSRTFHRYFPVKEDVLFADAEAKLASFEESLAARPADETVLESLRNSAYVLADWILEHPELELARHRLVESSTVVRAHGLRHTNEWARVVAEHAARRLRLDAADALPQLLGACTVAVLRTAGQQWAAHPATDLARQIDRGFDLIGHLADATTSREHER